MKKLALILLMVAFATTSFSKTVSMPYYDQGFMSKGIQPMTVEIQPLDKTIKPSQTFGISSETFDVGYDLGTYIWYQCNFTEPAPYNFRVVIGCYLYFQGFYNCGRPINCYGWHWGYKYVTLYGTTGQYYFPGEPIYTLTSGEQVNINNCYTSYVGQ